MKVDKACDFGGCKDQAAWIVSYENSSGHFTINKVSACDSTNFCRSLNVTASDNIRDNF